MEMDYEAQSFVELLNCIYRIPYKVDHHLVVDVTKLADYYRSLPAVSNNLYSCFWLSPDFDIVDTRSLIESPYKLRQPILFKYCVTYVAGTMITLPLSELQQKIENPSILHAVMTVRNKIFEEYLEAGTALHMNFDGSRVTEAEGRRLFATISEVCKELRGENENGLMQPLYYRTLADREKTFLEALKPVLSGKLQLDS
ncbi:hypothetical protein OCU04_004989 [Sclerotinia nivalis]|uniref:BTB domain-containing protein n=1 Tax=Sclerotinia nivalis TaxID=352851 RepID=A0A9X0AP47_9HELO|nr:hypothetical protein OCU04_004989 [Sclerotinia nivalis]